MSNQIRILIAAGGSGGHLLPAIEVAKKLKSLESSLGKNVIFEFVGVGRPVESKILNPLGYVHHVIPGIGLKGKGLLGFIKFIFAFPSAFFKTKKLLKTFKPNIVLGFGGYPSFFPIVAAFAKGIPTWIHEADSSPGLATKVLTLFATKISAGFENTKLPFSRKVIFTGHPVRSDIEAAPVPESGFVPQNILVLGGSQGASALDQAMPKSLSSINNNELRVVHQSRENAVVNLKETYQKLGINAKVQSFISNIPEELKRADLIVSRAGAGAVTELSLLNKPIIFVPLPKVSGHQLTNAKSVEIRGKALVVEEGEDFDEKFKEALLKLLDPKNYIEMMSRPKLHQGSDAALKIAEGVLHLLQPQ